MNFYNWATFKAAAAVFEALYRGLAIKLFGNPASDPAPKDVSRHWETIVGTRRNSPLVKEAMCAVTPENWKQAVKHAEQLQEHDTNQDRVVEMYVDSFIIHLSESSDDTSESD